MNNTQVLQVHPLNQVVQVGELSVIRCESKKYPNWSFNEGPLAANRILTIDGRKLYILKTQLYNSGSYTCWYDENNIIYYGIAELLVVG